MGGPGDQHPQPAAVLDGGAQEPQQLQQRPPVAGEEPLPALELVDAQQDAPDPRPARSRRSNCSNQAPSASIGDAIDDRRGVRQGQSALAPPLFLGLPDQRLDQ